MNIWKFGKWGDYMEEKKEKTVVRVEIKDKLLLTIAEAAALCNIGIHRMQDLTKDPKCSFVIYSGKKRLVKRKALEEFIEKNVEI